MQDFNIDNMQSQMKKGILEFCILAIINRNEIYPSDIALELNHAGMPILEGTLYPLLTRLKNSGYLEYRWVESLSGPPRKYFTISDRGKDFLKALENIWIDMSTAVNQITKS